MKICTKYFPESEKLVKLVEVNYYPLSVTTWHAFLLLLNTSLMLERYTPGNISQLWRSFCMCKMCLIIYYNNFSRFLELDGHRLLSLLMYGEVVGKNNGQSCSTCQHKPCEICDMIKSYQLDASLYHILSTTKRNEHKFIKLWNIVVGYAFYNAPVSAICVGKPAVQPLKPQHLTCVVDLQYLSPSWSPSSWLVNA